MHNKGVLQLISDGGILQIPISVKLYEVEK
jgi:hypothetical protein